MEVVEAGGSEEASFLIAEERPCAGRSTALLLQGELCLASLILQLSRGRMKAGGDTASYLGSGDMETNSSTQPAHLLLHCRSGAPRHHPLSDVIWVSKGCGAHLNIIFTFLQFVAVPALLVNTYITAHDPSVAKSCHHLLVKTHTL